MSALCFCLHLCFLGCNPPRVWRYGVCAQVQVLATAGADASALAYVRRMRRLNLTGRAAAAGDGAGPGGVSSSGGSTLAGLAGQSHLLNWADKTFGQGLTSLTKGDRRWDLDDQCVAPARGRTVLVSWRWCSAVLVPCVHFRGVRCATGVKVLLAGEQQAAVTVAVEGLMDGKPLPDLESFLTFDPKVRAIIC